VKKSIWIIILAALFFTACDPTPQACNNSGAPSLPGGVSGDELDKLLVLTNEARTHERLCGGVCYRATTPLQRNAILDSSARKHAEDMAVTHTLSHDTPAGAINYPANYSFDDRMRDEGYIGHWYGENIARGQADAESVIADWLESPGHCANIMNPNFKEIGLGLKEDDGGVKYWVQDFGAP